MSGQQLMHARYEEEMEIWKPKWEAYKKTDSYKEFCLAKQDTAGGYLFLTRLYWYEWVWPGNLVAVSEFSLILSQLLSGTSDVYSHLQQ